MEVCSKSLECISSAKLSPITISTYIARLNYMTEHTKVGLYQIIVNPAKYIVWIKAHSKSLQTQKSYISAILAMFKHTPTLKESEKTHYYIWYGEFKKIHDAIEERYKVNKPTDKQKDAYVPYKDIIIKRDTLPKGSKERLLLSLYTYLPPLRSDFNKVYIYKTPQPTYAYDNYILLFGDTKSTLVLNEFKTKKKDTYVKVLPPLLVQEIEVSLKVLPREWLFIDRSGNPYDNSSSFTKWTNRTLKTLFGKALTISLIRHSFINSLDFNTLTVKEKEEIAKDMAHTVDTQDRYRLIFS